ncbi:hypothetical protein JHN52_34370, partial [Streptomyces sp. MBT97]|nr:hypothetical protein [Streptomyces sp. MBT97]
MGFLERLRGRRGDEAGRGPGPTPPAGTGGPATAAAPAASSSTAGASTAGSSAAGSSSEAASAAVGDGGAAPRVVAAAWPTLPPIQRAAHRGPSGVADAGFGGRLATWQNPSFTGTGFRAVLDAAPGGSMSSLRAAPAAAEPERVALPPRPTPLQRAVSTSPAPGAALPGTAAQGAG